MALTRLTTWNTGDTLTAAALNNEFNNILNNALTLISPLTGALNFAHFEANNLVVNNGASLVSTTRIRGELLSQNTNHLLHYAPDTAGSTTPMLPLGPFSHRSLVQGLKGSLISNIGSFAAESYNVRTTHTFPGTLHVTATSSFSVDTQSAGPIANGRDTAAAIASTTVHFYVITTGIRSTAPAGVVSTVAPPTGPTLPSSYITWGYLGSAIYTVASSAMTAAAFINGSAVNYSSFANMLSSGSAATVTEISLGSRIPLIASQIIGQVRETGGLAPSAAPGQINIDHNIGLTSSATYLSLKTRVAGDTGAGQIQDYSRQMQFTVPNVNSTPALWYVHLYNTATSAVLTLDVLGYRVPNGDN